MWCVMDPFEDKSDALADANAQTHHREAAGASVQFARSCEHKAGAGRAKGMPDGDGPAIGIDPGIVLRQPQQLEAAEHLGREGLVDLDHVHVGQRQPGPRQRLGDRVGGPDTHDGVGRS